MLESSFTVHNFGGGISEQLARYAANVDKHLQEDTVGGGSHAGNCVAQVVGPRATVYSAHQRSQPVFGQMLLYKSFFLLYSSFCPGR